MLSIIVIAFNEEKYLPILLQSLADQTEKNFEVVVVDSNSTDRTGEMAESFRNSFMRFQYLKLDSKNGPAYARNKGAEVATFERLVFMDADTRVRSDFIEKIVHELDKYKPDVATCPIRIAERSADSNMGAIFLNVFMIVLRPFYSTAYGACFISTKTVHQKLSGFREDLGICEDCNYIKRARRQHNYKFRILSPFFFTSDRRAKNEGGIIFMLKYIRIHLYRMFTGKEILKGKIKYEYGEF